MRRMCNESSESTYKVMSSSEPLPAVDVAKVRKDVAKKLMLQFQLLVSDPIPHKQWDDLL